MAVAQEGKITIEKNLLTVRHFQTEDRDIVDYFCNLNESDVLWQKLEDTLKMGVLTMQSVDLTGDVLYVEKAFAKLDANFTQSLDSIFKDDGQFSFLLKEHFGDDGKIVKKLFDPHKEDTPLRYAKLLKKIFVKSRTRS